MTNKERRLKEIGLQTKSLANGQILSIDTPLLDQIDMSHLKWSLTPRVEVRYPNWIVRLK